MIISGITVEKGVNVTEWLMKKAFVRTKEANVKNRKTQRKRFSNHYPTRTHI